MRGKAIIISAPSGSGKTTIANRLSEQIPTLTFSISATTRAKRSSETDKKEYYFLSKQAFRDKIASQELLEWEEVYENTFYGTLNEEVERIWKSGNHVLFDVDIQGGLNLKKKLGDLGLSIFIKVSDPDVLKSRLIKRNTESESSLRMRMEKALLEMKEESRFDKIIVNDELNRAVEQTIQTVNEFLRK